MQYGSVQDFLARGRDALAKGPVALIFLEDPVEVESTLRHHVKAGFRAVLALGIDVTLPEDLAAKVHLIRHDLRSEGAMVRAVNTLTAACPPGTWLYYGYNAEYLFHPFAETRNVRELLAFHTEERRDSMLCYVVDLYAPDLSHDPNGVNVSEAMLDRTGYFALARKDPAKAWEPRERQLDFFGGLRWRFEEHIAPARRKIDRIALFKAKPGLVLRADHTFNDEEYNTYSCPWHHNLTAAVMSFRVAKALRTNPGSRDRISGFRWHNSVSFAWHSQQLLDLGLIEPGQWF